MTSLRHPLLVLLCLLTLIGCSGTKKIPVTNTSISGARSGIMSIDMLIRDTTGKQTVRNGALLGIFVSAYLSDSLLQSVVHGALTAIATDQHLIDLQQNIHDPDYDLLQAFADALQVDVADLLNRSTERQASLDTYTTALQNVAAKANDRYNELTSAETLLKETLRTQGKDKSDAERALKNALSKKDFSQAGELQKKVLETQQIFAETDLKSKQTQNVLDTFDNLLTLYEQKILAIQQNREVLIAGNKVVDVPGIEELKIIERKKGSGRGGAKSFNSLFQTL